MINKIILGDCIEHMKELPENSVDAIITDPPYGLEFMGKDWDKFKQGLNIGGGTTGIGTPFGRSKAMPSFYQMNKKRFGIKGEEGENDLKVKKNFNILPRFFQSDLLGFQEFTTNWASECLRVLKPGGYLLSFGGTRTYHRMACGIEDAGFEIRDTIMWVYGSGFPKSLNVSKAIEKIRERGDTQEEFETEMNNDEKLFCKWIKEESGITAEDLRKIIGHDRFYTGKVYIVNTATAERPIYGRRSNVPTYEAWNKIKEYIKVKIPNEIEEVVKKEAEGLLRGPGQEQTWQSGKGEGTKSYNEWGGWGTALKPALEPIVVARKPLSEKNVALNVLKWGTGGINIDECRIPTNEVLSIGSNNHSQASVFQHNQILNSKQNELGRFPANIILDEEAGRMLDEQSGIKKGNGHWSKTKVTGFGEFGNGKSEYFGVGEKDTLIGGASRFFYCAKASKSERNNGCEELEEQERRAYTGAVTSDPRMNHEQNRFPTKNNHPTVKPVALMEYLIKLVSRENAVILDPFLGSGTTAIACLKTNRKFIGIEKEPEYVKIAQARIKPYLEQIKLLLPEEKQDE